MIAQKSAPTLGRLGVFRGSAHPAGDSSFGNFKTQHQKLTANTRCAPGRVFRDHPKDQIANFLRNRSSTAHLVGLGNRTPIERESRSVPTHDGLRTHDHKSLFPSGIKPPQQNPEELIECGQPWSRMSSLQCRELLAKSQVFKKDLVTSAEDSKDRTYQESDGVYHARVLSHFHCGRQRFYPVQITSGQNFANDTGCARVMPGLETVSSGLSRAFAILPRLKQRRAVP